MQPADSKKITYPGLLSGATLMCHAPIVLPEIAGPRAREVALTTESMQKAARALLATRPELLVVISPHTPRHRSAWGIVTGPSVEGDFGDFGSPEIGVRLPGPATAAEPLIEQAKALGLAIERLPDLQLDHGAMVPLYFMQEAGWSGPTLVLSFPYSPTHEGCRIMGEAIARAARKSSQRWAILASGDMSHRLQPGAPSGYHPRARDFDTAFCECVRTGRLLDAVQPDEALRRLAAEDVVDSVEVAVAATNFNNQGVEFFSYEGPFGVGYLVAQLFREGHDARQA